jgi:ubiquinone/menaquinone biosynthesis C-methylase UbiE
VQLKADIGTPERSLEPRCEPLPFASPEQKFTTKPDGWEHYEEYRDGHHEQMAENWPEPRDQLHGGGLAMTEVLEADLEIEREKGRVLDVCCGEGATATRLAAKYGHQITGIDIVGAAVSVARQHAAKHQVQNLVGFTEGSIFHMPFGDNSFSLIIGQDPDGFTHPKRITAFKECWRVLQPNGRIYLHTFWIPGFGWSEKQHEDYVEFNKKLGWMCDRLRAEEYIADLKGAGFVIEAVSSLTDIALTHFNKMAEMHEERHGMVNDPWLLNNQRMIAEGHEFGVKVQARKKVAGQVQAV